MAVPPPLPPEEDSPPPSHADTATIATVATILATGLPIATTGSMVIAALTTAGVSFAAATAAWTLLSATLAPLGDVGPAGVYVDSIEFSYRAAYLLNASRRIMASLKTGDLRQALANERRYFKLHLQATANRKIVGQNIDATVKTHGPMLRWKSVMDARTSAECRKANGSVFSIHKPPAIGLPGSVHPSCRCTAVPAKVNAPVRVRQLVGA